MANDLYLAIGGTEGCRRLAAAFYARVDGDWVLRPMFPGKSLRCAIDAFAAYLVQFLGGPQEDSEFRFWVSLRESHLRFRIGAKQREAWMSDMARALEDVEIAEPVRGALRDFFERSSAYLVNQGEDCRVEGECPHAELARRWSGQVTLDGAVAAVRRGNAAEAIRLASEGADSVGLLGLMLGCEGAMRDYVRARVKANPALRSESYYGRTLLNRAGAAADLATVELLLSLGADANAGETAPLYSVGNECAAKGGGDVVRALVRGGADVNAPYGVKQCTALHMAARRGNVEVAEALLECGAEMETRDSTGETPLRRAVNCNKAGVAELLIARGANADSVGSKGLTPRSAARSARMRLVVHAIAIGAVLFLGMHARAQSSGPASNVTKFMGRSVTIAVPERDADGFFPKGPASICVEGLPQRQCYTAPKDFGNSPKATVVQVEKGLPAILFSAESGGVSGWSIHFALLRPGTGKDLQDLFLEDISVSNQSQYAFWSDSGISDAQIFVTANYVWGPNEGHYDEHRYMISVYALKASSPVDDRDYYLEDRYMTVHKYDLEGKADVLGSERQEILARLRRVKMAAVPQHRTPR